VFQPTVGAELDRAFDQILRDLRTQYLLGFYPKDVPLTRDRYHQLQVTVHDPSLRVVARSGYYGEAQPDTASNAGSMAPAGVNADSAGDTTMRPRKPVPAHPAEKGKGR
jgi:hypothetical protein